MRLGEVRPTDVLLNPRSLAQSVIEGVRAGLVLLRSVPCKRKYRQAFRMPFNISSEGFFNKDGAQGVTFLLISVNPLRSLLK